METVKREVVEEFHYAMDGRNPVRQPVGSMATIKAADRDKLINERKIAPLLPDDIDLVEPEPLNISDEERAALPPLDGETPAAIKAKKSK